MTGGAGFIGMHTVLKLLAQGHDVVSVDNLNDYYDVTLKHARLEHVAHTHQQQNWHASYEFVQLDVADNDALTQLFQTHHFDYVCHLAAQAGVRYSIENPQAYIHSNLQGFANILEQCRHNSTYSQQHQPIKHLVYASSSSVYGKSDSYPYAENQPVDNPISLYAATKKSNELMAHVYSHLYAIPTSGLRFFTVYGAWGRPDMAYFKFTQAIEAGKTIDIYNHGDLARDFTYIDDIVEGVVRCIFHLPTQNKQQHEQNEQGKQQQNKQPAYAVYNIGNNTPVKLLDFVETLESVLGKTAQKNMLPMQAGDVYATHANIDKLQNAVGFAPATPLKEGLAQFYAWYQAYYH